MEAVNTIANVEYCVNIDLLNILTTNHYFKNGKPLVTLKPHPKVNSLNELIINKDYTLIDEITKHNSKYLSDTSIISIAKLMSYVEGFYITVFIDWRGRLYSSNCILNIQGGELARSLLLFKKGEVLSDNGVKALKIYTANAMGLDKKSKKDRIEWVESNIKEIISSPDNDLWLKADEPLLFLACALELKGYYNSPTTIISRLPILMDATCNGLQHLAAMAGDMTLAEKVNMVESYDVDSPNDVYSDIVPVVQDGIKELVEGGSVNHSNLLLLNVNRKLVKRGIMTRTYGVTVRGISKQLMSDHFVKVGLVNKQVVYKPLDISMGDVLLNSSNIYKLGEIIYNSLFEIHPRLEELMTYFKAIVKLLNRLDLSINWITPSGLMLQQKYIKFTKYEIFNTSHKRKVVKVTLQKPKLVGDKHVINTHKQINSFIPNFIILWMQQILLTLSIT